MDWQVLNMLIKFLRDDMKQFTLGGSYTDSASWGMTKVNGLGSITMDISKTKNAVGDGETITSIQVPARPIDIVANVKNVRNNQIERAKAISFFNPKHSFIMYVTRGNDTRWIQTRIDKFKCQEQPPYKAVEIEMALICEDPYFYSKDNYGKDIAAVTGTFGFPFISSVEKGFKVGVYNFAKQVEVENTGDVETYMTIRIEAFGTVINPKVVKDHAYIRLIDTLSSGDIVEIDMVENTIRKNGVNCIGKTDRTSSFTGMAMDVGDNTISFTADSGDTNMKVVLYYNLKYLGA